MSCENQLFAYAKTKVQISCAVTADEHVCFRYIDSVIPLLSKSKFLSLKPSYEPCYEAVQSGLCWTWSEGPKTGFPATQLI